MTLRAAGEASSSSFLTFLLLGGLIFTFGYARAVWVRARKDYKATKAAVKPLRKAMWTAIWNATRLGALVTVLGLLLFVWVVRDVRDVHEQRQQTPAKVTSPSPARR